MTAEMNEEAGKSAAAEGVPLSLFSTFDKLRLKRVMKTQQTSEVQPDFSELERKIASGAECMPHEMPPDIVTMNSMILVTNVDTAASYVFTIVYPVDANTERGRISIFEPLATAMLGHSVGDIVQWRSSEGLCRWRIEKLIYQPEAAGDFHR